jgi:hypothetical protein
MMMFELLVLFLYDLETGYLNLFQIHVWVNL